MIRKTTIAFCSLAVLTFAAGETHADFDLAEIRLPPGFEIEEYVERPAKRPRARDRRERHAVRRHPQRRHGLRGA